ncbi:hypothetical protein FZD47_25495 [Bacillus infantis]|uniref:Uncharacterized protein n=1 Tax=Bacillus infantis TaxID=324767 RepID=A0A5D4S1N7_9BACI|nr:hypothetical protein [Bacillus infantis]TYS55782.1 hypothetical protein FZD47_25495 [Bacillus infantis]
MLGISLPLNVREKNLITLAIESYLPLMKKTEMPIFQLTLKKMKEERPLLDGMYMRCVEQSLTTKGDPESLMLAAWIEQQRIQFQHAAMNWPQVTA